MIWRLWKLAERAGETTNCWTAYPSSVFRDLYQWCWDSHSPARSTAFQEERSSAIAHNFENKWTLFLKFYIILCIFNFLYAFLKCYREILSSFFRCIMSNSQLRWDIFIEMKILSKSWNDASSYAISSIKQDFLLKWMKTFPNTITLVGTFVRQNASQLGISLWWSTTVHFKLAINITK